MDAALKTATLSLIQVIALIAGVGFGGWAFVCLTRQQIQKSIFYLLSAIFLLGLWNFTDAAQNTFSLSGISIAGAVEAQNPAVSSALNSVGFALSIVGYTFFMKSIFMFSRIPDRQTRPSECFLVLGSAILLINFGSILQILLNTVSAK
jgi:hypothetical protein